MTGEATGNRRPGKPAIGPTIKVALPAETIAALNQLAARLQITRAKLIRDTIIDYLTERSP